MTLLKEIPLFLKTGKSRFNHLLKYSSLFIVVLLSACNETYDEYIQQREERAKETQQAKKDIVIGVAWPKDHSGYFMEGVNLAVEELNEAGGIKMSNRCEVCIQARSEKNNCEVQKVNCDKYEKFRQLCDTCKRQQISSGREWSGVKVTFLSGEKAYLKPPNPNIRNASQALANEIARQFANNLDIIAVIGHPPSAEAVPASVTYKSYGILFIAPASTNAQLTRPSFNLTFRTIPNNQQMADQLAGFCALNKHYKRMVLLNVRTEYGEELVNSFAESASQLGIQIVHNGSFFAGTTNFRDNIIATFKMKEFDAIFLAAGSKDGSELIKQSRDIGVTQPFIGGDALYSEKLANVAGKEAAEGTVVPTVYKPTFNIAQPFIQRYKEKYKEEPEIWSAQGYDSIKLLAHAIERADSIVPSTLATTLRYMPPWVGVTGVHAFDRYGEIEGKQFSFSILHNGKFEAMPDAHLPYLFYKLEKRSTDTPR
jgi:branched-chain amino acid transport system substrate-binding protein